MFELLVSEDKRSYFINCKRDGDLLEVGAVYLAPNSGSFMKLVSDDGVTFTVVLPLEAQSNSSELVKADTSFFIN